MLGLDPTLSPTLSTQSEIPQKLVCESFPGKKRPLRGPAFYYNIIIFNKFDFKRWPVMHTIIWLTFPARNRTRIGDS